MGVSATFDPVWIASLLPHSATKWERAVELADSDMVARDPVSLISLARVSSDCPAPWLPYLAAERSVDEFSGAWPIARRRQAVQVSFLTHRAKGTRAVFDRAFAAIGYSVRVVEWFETSQSRRPNTFRISLTLDGDREWVGGRGEVVRVANRSKNAHTKLEAIEVLRVANPSVAFVGGYPIRRRTIRVGQVPKATSLHLPAFAFVGAAITRRRTVRVGTGF